MYVRPLAKNPTEAIRGKKEKTPDSSLFPAFSHFAYDVYPLWDMNPFPDTPFWDRTKSKEAADDNKNVSIKGFKDTDCIENIVEKGEIAHFEQFHIFSAMFSQSFFLLCVKMSTYGGKGLIYSNFVQFFNCKMPSIWRSLKYCRLL